MEFRKLSPEELIAKSAYQTAQEARGKPRTPIYVILDNIRSLYNVGAIFRTCDAICAEKLYLCGMTGMPPRKEIEKTSLGAHTVMPWEYRKSTLELVKELKEKGVKVVALELTESSENYIEAEYEYPLAVIVGHEIDGISDDVLEIVDKAIYIPMLGRAVSLNVATACGIVAYRLLDKYQQNHK